MGRYLSGLTDQSVTINNIDNRLTTLETESATLQTSQSNLTVSDQTQNSEITALQTAITANITSNTTVGLAQINNQTGTSYTLQLTDIAADIICTNSGPISVIIPTHATIPLDVGTLLTVSQGGTGIVTVSGQVGVSVVGANGFITGAMYDSLALEQIALDVWRVI